MSTISQNINTHLTSLSTLVADGNLAEALHSPALKKQVLDEIPGVMKAVSEIKDEFVKVGNDLAIFDSNDYKDINNQPLKLRETWNAYLHTFNELRTQNKTLAGKAALEVTEYSKVILNNTDAALSAKDVEKGLSSMNQLFEKHHEDFNRTLSSFKALAKNVGLYATTIDETAHAAKAGTEKTSADGDEKLKWIRDFASRTDKIKDIKASIDSVNSIWLVVVHYLADLKAKFGSIDLEKYASQGLQFDVNEAREIHTTLVAVLHQYVGEVSKE